MTEKTVAQYIAESYDRGFSDGIAQMAARPISEYHESMGDVLWWKFPVTEPPYVGKPIDCPRVYGVHVNYQKVGEHLVGGWPGYHTHFTEFEIPPDPTCIPQDTTAPEADHG